MQREDCAGAVGGGGDVSTRTHARTRARTHSLSPQDSSNIEAVPLLGALCPECITMSVGSLSLGLGSDEICFHSEVRVGSLSLGRHSKFNKSLDCSPCDSVSSDADIHYVPVTLNPTLHCITHR